MSKSKSAGYTQRRYAQLDEYHADLPKPNWTPLKTVLIPPYIQRRLDDFRRIKSLHGKR